MSADHHVTRRACAARLLALPAIPLGLRAAPKHGGALQSAALDFELQLADGKVTSRRLTNRLVNEIIDLPADDFELEFEKDRNGLWAWLESAPAGDPVLVAAACGEPAMPQYRAGIERHGICLKAPQ